MRLTFVMVSRLSAAFLMCTKVFTALALIGTLLVCGVVVDGSSNSAEARDFYTRKRVNGVWITGRFEWKRPARTETDEAAPGDRSSGSSTATGIATDRDHPPPLQRAFEARRAAIASVLSDPIPQTSDLLPLRRALESRARTMAAAPGAGSMQVRGVRSMTLDFENRIRTIQFVDGSLAEEPLDPIATGGLSANAIP